MQRLIIILIASVLLLTGSVARAEDQTSLLLTDDQIATIRTNCVDVQATLERVHASDALARVNLGQRYENVSTKLMAPMNSRIALNRLDGVELAQTAVDFSDKLNEFRTRYQQYEQTMLHAIQIKCRDQPVAFYDTINLARTHRASVRESVVALSGLLKQYGSQFDAFSARVLARKGTS